MDIHIKFNRGKTEDEQKRRSKLSEKMYNAKFFIIEELNRSQHKTRNEFIEVKNKLMDMCTKIINEFPTECEEYLYYLESIDRGSVLLHWFKKAYSNLNASHDMK